MKYYCFWWADHVSFIEQEPSTKQPSKHPDEILTTISMLCTLTIIINKINAHSFIVIVLQYFAIIISGKTKILEALFFFCNVY